TDLHQLQTFAEARHHLGQRNRHRLAVLRAGMLGRRVEGLAVEEAADILDLHRVARSRTLAGALLQDLVLQARSRHLHARRALVLGQERFALFLVFRRDLFVLGLGLGAQFGQERLAYLVGLGL